MREPWSSYLMLAWPLVAALLAGWVARRVLLAWARGRGPDGRRRAGRRVLEVVALPASIAVPLLFLSLAIDAMPLPPAWIGHLRHVLVASGGGCLTWLAVRAIGAIEQRVLRHHPVDVADNLKKSGGFVPGIRPGKQTADYINKLLSRLTFVGALYLSVVCMIPALLQKYINVPFRFGGTGLLIIVGVALDTVQQVESHLITRNYEGLAGARATKIRGRRDLEQTEDA